MTSQPPAETGSSDTSVFESTPAHSDLADWLKGRQPDKAIAAMMVSAGSKKPGKVIKRVSKPLGSVFAAPKVVKWEKAEKFVYAHALTRAKTSEVFQAGGNDTVALFQTDLYLRTRDDHTEINATTVCALTQDAFDQLRTGPAADHNSDDRALLRKALTAARIFSTGLEGAGIQPNQSRQVRIPFGADFLLAKNHPVARSENGEEKIGQVLMIVSAGAADELDGADRQALDAMAQAMTKEGHPGADAFADLVRKSIVD